MKKTLLSMCASLLAACGGGGGGAPVVVGPTPVITACSVEVNGDSIIVGPTLSPTPMQRLGMLRPGLEIIDKGISGLTLNSLYNGYGVPYDGAPAPRLGTQLRFNQIQRTSRIVVVELGGNDAYSSLPAVTFEQQLRAIVATIQGEGRVPVLTGIVKLTAAGAFDQGTVDRAAELNVVIHRVAVEMGVIHAGWDEVPFAGEVETIDGIHRTQAASDRLVEQLAKTLDQICKA